jgi:DNA-binding PadR family transcriptional regulator
MPAIPSHLSANVHPTRSPDFPDRKAVLGLRSARRFDKSIGYFWHATHQQIYRELGRMAELGWIASDEPEVTIDGDGARRKAARRSTGVARRARRTGAMGAVARSGLDQREEILVKLRADAAIGPLGLDKEMGRLIALHEARLETYRGIERRISPARSTAGSRSSTHCSSAASSFRKTGRMGQVAAAAAHCHGAVAAETDDRRRQSSD